MTRADDVRLAWPLFQAERGGCRPTSALQLRFQKIDFIPAKALNRLWHSRFPETGGGNARVCYAAEFDGQFWAVAIWTNPSSPKLPQRSWIMLKRWAIADERPKNTASRMDGWMFRDLARRFPEVEMAVSYSDPDSHEGAIYRACGWSEGETTTRKAGGKRWKNRTRPRQTANDECQRVTRWTKRVR